jgi:anti-sigma regulatory factor (Ser/Thr protein kinase)
VISPEKVIYENSFSVAGKTFENAGLVSTQVKALLRTLNLPRDVIRRVAIVTYEAEMNICSYADRGKINLRVTPKKIYIEAIDEGQGIADIEVAMREGYSTATEKIWHMGFGAGMGLSNIRRFADSFIITSEVGKGTHLRMMIEIA